MMSWRVVLVGIGAWIAASAQEDSLLRRRYVEGEKLAYRMTAVNDGRRYEARAAGVVKRDSSGKFIEEYVWQESPDFRQIVSLDPGVTPAIPDLSKVQPRMIGPITDFLTFYADLWLALQESSLRGPGDRAYKKHGTPASWADGRRVVLGEDSIDFDITLAKVDRSARIATLVVRHVVPAEPQVKLPVAWMREAVAGTPNNWVQVTKKDGKYVAAVGKETFDVQMKVSLIDGKILSATLDNPVTWRERECLDAALTSCTDPRPGSTLRQIEISLEQ